MIRNFNGKGQFFLIKNNYKNKHQTLKSYKKALKSYKKALKSYKKALKSYETSQIVQKRVICRFVSHFSDFDILHLYEKLND